MLLSKRSDDQNHDQTINTPKPLRRVNGSWKKIDKNEEVDNGDGHQQKERSKPQSHSGKTQYQQGSARGKKEGGGNSGSGHRHYNREHRDGRGRFTHAGAKSIKNDKPDKSRSAGRGSGEDDEEEEEKEDEGGSSDGDATSDSPSGSDDDEDNRDDSIAYKSLQYGDISDPIRHYPFALCVFWDLNLTDHQDDSAPLQYEFPPDVAKQFFRPDPRSHIDISVFDNSHTRVDISKAIPKCICRTAYYNPTDFYLGVRISTPGAEPLNKIFYDTSDSSSTAPKTFFAILAPQSNVNDSVPLMLYDGSKMVSSKMARRVGHLDKDKLRAGDIELSDGDDYGSISAHGPYAQILKNSNQISNSGSISEKNGRIRIPKEIIFKCVKVFEDNIYNSITHLDLSNLKFELYKLSSGKYWDDLSQTVYYTLEGDQKQEYLDRSNRVSISLSMETAFPTLYPQTKNVTEKMALIEEGLKGIGAENGKAKK